MQRKVCLPLRRQDTGNCDLVRDKLHRAPLDETAPKAIPSTGDLKVRPLLKGLGQYFYAVDLWPPST